jgi:hypothetical protein
MSRFATNETILRGIFDRIRINIGNIMTFFKTTSTI